jgi:hypothetical protein
MYKFINQLNRFLVFNWRVKAIRLDLERFHILDAFLAYRGRRELYIDDCGVFYIYFRGVRVYVKV